MVNITIVDSTSEHLASFISKINNKHFRYFENRNKDAVKNHVLTIIGCENNLPIAYGHLDYEDGIYWLGVCVLDAYQGKGHGTRIIEYILDNTDKTVQLSVDHDNYRAIGLYLKFNFELVKANDKSLIMKRSNIIKLPVSLGEALDKLTILDIKTEKISDVRCVDIKYEYDLLNGRLNDYVTKHWFYYKTLRTINESIWDKQDEFRMSTDQNRQNELCQVIIKENDNRFRIKRKINNVCNSILKEQKGYEPTKAFVLTHLGLGDIICAIGAIRYLATCYDKVYVTCKRHYSENVKLFFGDDDTIELYIVNGDRCISPKFGCSMEKFAQATNGMDVYLAGRHCIEKKHMPFRNLPFNFYKDMDMSSSIFWNYFYIDTIKDSQNLYCQFADYEYVFVHNIASTGQVFDLAFAKKTLNITDDTVILNPCLNFYSKEHKYYHLAESILGYKLAAYKDLIMNASKLLMTDSSFFCLAVSLPLKTKHFYLRPRGRDNSSHNPYSGLREGKEFHIVS